MCILQGGPLVLKAGEEYVFEAATVDPAAFKRHPFALTLSGSSGGRLRKMLTAGVLGDQPLTSDDQKLRFTPSSTLYEHLRYGSTKVNSVFVIEWLVSEAGTAG